MIVKGEVMLKKSIRFALVFISSMIIAGNPIVFADGLFEEDALPMEAPIMASPPPLIEEALPLPQVEGEKSTAKPSIEDKPDLWPAISQGMIMLKAKADGEISASEDQKHMLGQGDIVYLSSYDKRFVPQEESVIFKIVKPVHHPTTGAYLGDLVDVLGVVRVSDIGQDVLTGKIVLSNNPISKTDKIASIDRFIPPAPKSLLLPNEGTEATIVEFRENRRSVGQHDIVYIDQGNEEGIIPGDRFVVIHGGERFTTSTRTSSQKMGSGIQIPYREVGIVVILATQEHTATGKLTNSSEEISKGDTLLYLSQNDTTDQ